MDTKVYFKFTSQGYFIPLNTTLPDWVVFKNGNTVIDSEYKGAGYFDLPENLIGKTLNYEIIPSFLEKLSGETLLDAERLKRVVVRSLNKAIANNIKEDIQYVLVFGDEDYEDKARRAVKQNQWFHGVGPDEVITLYVYSSKPVKMKYYQNDVLLEEILIGVGDGVYSGMAHERMALCII